MQVKRYANNWLQLEWFVVTRWAVDKTRNMEHPRTFRNIPKHLSDSDNYDENM